MTDPKKHRSNGDAGDEITNKNNEGAVNYENGSDGVQNMILSATAGSGKSSSAGSNSAMGGFNSPRPGESGSLEQDVRSGLRKLFNSHELADVRLHGFEDSQGVGTLEQIPAHRLVLSLRSPVFRERFKVGGAWYGRTDIKSEILDLDVMRAVIRFMYTDSLEIPAGNVHLGARVHAAARLFGIKLLEVLAGEWLSRTVSEARGSQRGSWYSTALAVLQFALDGRGAAQAMSVDENRLDGCVDIRLARSCLAMIHAELDEARPAKRAALFEAMHDRIDNLKDGTSAPCDAAVCSEVLLEVTGSVESPRLMEYAVVIGRSDIVLNLISRGVDPDAPSSLSGLLPVEIALQLSKNLSATGESLFQTRKLKNKAESVDDLYSAASVGAAAPRSPTRNENSGNKGNNIDSRATKKNTNQRDLFKPNGDTSEDSINDAENLSNLGRETSTSTAGQAEARIARIIKEELGFEPSWADQEDMTRIVETLILGARRGAVSLDKRDQLQHHSMLNLAARLGNARHVEALVEAGADINECDPSSGRCALHCAAEGGHADVVRVLLANNAVHNQQDNNGCTALHLACRRGHVAVVELLQAAVNVMIPDRFGWTALHHAARKGHAEVSLRVLQECEDPLGLIMATEYDQGSTALHLAASNAHYRVVLVILDMARELDEEALEDQEEAQTQRTRGGSNAAANNSDTQSTSGAATPKSSTFADDQSVSSRRSTRSGGHPKLPRKTNIDNYLHCRTITNAKDLHSRTPLHCACTSACDAIVRGELAMVSSSASVKSTNESDNGESVGATPEFEFFRRACKVIETLLDAKADVMGRTKLGYVPLHFALGGQRSHNASSDSPARKEATRVRTDFAALRQLQDPSPAQRARIENTTRLLTILLGVPGGHEAIRAEGSDGVTPLHCAVRYGHVRAVTVLVRGYADPNARDKSGATPLALARETWPLPLLVNALLKQLPAAPRWVEDSEVTSCETCKSVFSFTNRKHHCRCCHSIHCSTCASRKMAIPKFGIDSPVRVCDACHEALSWPEMPDEDEEGSEIDDYSDGVDEDTFQDDLDRRESQARSVASSNSGRSFLSSQRRSAVAASSAAVSSAAVAAPGPSSNVKHIRVTAEGRRKRNVNLS